LLKILLEGDDAVDNPNGEGEDPGEDPLSMGRGVELSMSGLKTVTKKSGAYQLRNIPKMFEEDDEGAAGLKNGPVGLSNSSWTDEDD
jgi:hypothetical protein